MKFDDPNSGNKLKDGHYPGKLRQCLPVFAKCKAFPFSKARTAIMLSQSSWYHNTKVTGSHSH